jgi:pyridoxine kinase
MSNATSIISIQSQVVHGHVGNSAAALPMQARGLNVAAVPTTLLSNHPGYDTMRGRVLESELVADLLRGVEERGLIQSSRYIVSGYVGSRANGEVIADFVERARRINPNITYVCDPVMGDVNLGIFVHEQVVECMLERLVPLADILTPNQFELGLISGGQAQTFDELHARAQAVIARRHAQLIVTSSKLADTPAMALENIVIGPDRYARLRVPLLPIVPVGTGDLFTGLVTANLACGYSLVDAADSAAQVVLDVLRCTIAAGSAEMQLGSVIGILTGTGTQGWGGNPVDFRARVC